MNSRAVAGVPVTAASAGPDPFSVPGVAGRSAWAVAWPVELPPPALLPVGAKGLNAESPALFEIAVRFSRWSAWNASSLFRLLPDSCCQSRGKVEVVTDMYQLLFYAIEAHLLRLFCMQLLCFNS